MADGSTILVLGQTAHRASLVIDGATVCPHTMLSHLGRVLLFPFSKFCTSALYLHDSHTITTEFKFSFITNSR